MSKHVSSRLFVQQNGLKKRKEMASLISTKQSISSNPASKVRQQNTNYERFFRINKKSRHKTHQFFAKDQKISLFMLSEFQKKKENFLA